MNARIVILLSALLFVLCAIYAASRTPVVPLSKAQLEHYDIVAPRKCLPVLQEYMHSMHNQPLDMKSYLELRPKLAACGGRFIAVPQQSP
jgi:hypothetical protein